MMQAGRIAETLRRSALFSDLEDEVLNELAGRTVERTFRKGERIFYQGDPGDSLYVIASGMVKVVVTSEHGDEMVLVTLRDGESFGELALIDGRPRSATAEAVDQTTVLILGRETMLDLMQGRRNVTEGLLRSLGGLIRRLTEQTSDLVFLDLHGRVAKLLVGMAEERGKPSEEGILLDLHLTQSDLASMVGGSRQSVNQILRSFEQRGYLTLQGRAVSIQDIERLRKRAMS